MSSIEDFMKQAYENLQKKEKKPKRKQQQQQQVTETTAKAVRPPEKITLADVDQAYTDTGFKPMQDEIFFVEGDTLMHASCVNDDDTSASPIGAMVTLKIGAIAPEQETIFTALFDKPSHTWAYGSMSQLLGFSCSYILGFKAGFNDYAKPHSRCGKPLLDGYRDGKEILEVYRDRNLLPEKDPDPFEDEEDIAILKELTRITGHWRDDWGDRPDWVGDRMATIDELEQELEEIVENLEW